jgi:hypothetical protein
MITKLGTATTLEEFVRYLTEEQTASYIRKFRDALVHVREGRLSIERVDTALENLLNPAHLLTPPSPFYESIGTILRKLVAMNGELDLGLNNSEIETLYQDPGSWPDGKRAFRVLEIAVGKGKKGVNQTFDLHLKCIKHVFGAGNVWLAPQLRGAHPTLQLGDTLSNWEERKGGVRNINREHKPVLSWVIENLDHEDADFMRAHETLGLVWQYPNFIREMKSGEKIVLGRYVVDGSGKGKVSPRPRYLTVTYKKKTGCVVINAR